MILYYTISSSLISSHQLLVLMELYCIIKIKQKPTSADVLSNIVLLYFTYNYKCDTKGKNIFFEISNTAIMSKIDLDVTPKPEGEQTLV